MRRGGCWPWLATLLGVAMIGAAVFPEPFGGARPVTRVVAVLIGLVYIATAAITSDRPARRRRDDGEGAP
jgi:hypothetical protein